MENFKQVIFVLSCILMLYAFMYLGIMIKNIALYFMRKSELIKKENSNVFTTIALCKPVSFRATSPVFFIYKRR